MLRWQYAERRDRFGVDLLKARKTLRLDHWMEYDAWRAKMVKQRDEDWDEYLIWRRRDNRRVVVLLPLVQTVTDDGAGDGALDGR
jgi:hypothetical protein